MGSVEEEEVLGEVEAMEAVYGIDFHLLSSFPLLFHLNLFPRTADDSSQQFVEAIIEIRATPKYPKEPPCVDIVDCKGMDEKRRKHLLHHIQTKAHELCPGFMLVALCEEAVEKLSAMNHPDGDCPLCLLPLVPTNQQSETLPFMKLMSCFHCFHSECIIRWWNYLQKSKETDSAKSGSSTMHPNKENYKKVEEGIGNCPVCRKPFHVKDLEHVLDLVGSHSSQVSLDSDKATDEEELLQSEHEIIRRQKFEVIFNLQKENSGLIEPKKDLVILPGMYLPQPAATPSSTSTQESDEQQEKDIPTVISEKHAGETSNPPSSSRHKNFGARRQRPRSDNHSSSTVRNPRKPVQQQWVRRDNNPNSKQ
ncbi:PREDICTED: E3 ubiquitin-protein ligase RNF25 isoform X1 [Lupinus angustifolius]|uniref:E3 ubiquitin-protein ligase RNF25 isoform X1 n=1 Tax=Lupinus angustifolius TaxID=3871 RepID=UPI00092E809C|nr:PREDICTED: E3 ubiquitin-protein ligase RNF25 isoform X1 [Lupinus angustifolius]